MYRKHILIGIVSLIIGLFLSKYLNRLWYTNVNAYLKEVASTGVRNIYFNHIYMTVGCIVGLITGIGLKPKMDLIVIRLVSGPLFILLIQYIFFGVKAAILFITAFFCAFTISILLSHLSSGEDEMN